MTDRPLAARSLLLGLDGLDPDLVRALGPSRLPHLHALAARGVLTRLESVRPAATLPNWTTLLTGLDPGRHGVFDFTTRHGYAVRFSGGTVRQAPTIAAHLDRAGLRCACLGFPATWPPERLARGVFVSGWDSPVAFEADRSFVWPPTLWDALRARFGSVRFDDVDELGAEAPGWHARLPDALCARVARKAELGAWLLDRGPDGAGTRAGRGGAPWDVFAIYFGESDTAAHYLWSLHDPGSPRRPAGVSARDADGLARVYAALDEAVGRLVEEAGGERVEVTVVSDHGAGGSSDRVLYLNRALAEAGLCALRPSRGGLRALGARAAAAVRDRAPAALPPAWRDRTFRWAGRGAPGWLESRARFGAIDFAHTAAFSDELNYFPSVHLNVRGREPEGTIAPSDVERVRREVADALRALRDPWDGTPVVRAVHARESLYEGPWVGRAPDLVLELELPGGYSYNLMPSAGAPAGAGPWRRLGPEEHLGRKGRSLPGSHRSHGVLAMAGPSVRALDGPRADALGARMADVTATLLARLDAPGVEHAAGRVLEAALHAGGSPGGAARAPAGAVAPPPRPARRGEAATGPSQDAADAAEEAAAIADEALVEARLRALGYVD